MNNKIYCYKCKFFNLIENSSGNECWHPSCFKIKTTEKIKWGKHTSRWRINYCSKKNGNFDCKDFQPAFWVRFLNKIRAEV